MTANIATIITLFLLFFRNFFVPGGYTEGAAGYTGVNIVTKF